MEAKLIQDSPTDAESAALRFPVYEQRVREFVNGHASLPGGPMHLAVYYAPHRDPEDVFVLEVLADFSGGLTAEDRELFEVAYPSPSGFPLAGNRNLRLVLASPKELLTAVRQRWNDAVELKRAVAEGRAVVLLADEVGEDLMQALR